MSAPSQSRVQYHREWLHVLEDDTSVPDYALFVARVYADFSGISRSSVIWVGWSALQRMTHMHNDKISRALHWLTEHGWLKEEGTPARGKRLSRRLMIPAANHSATPEYSGGSEYSVRPESEYSDRSELKYSGRSEHEQQEQH